MGRHKSKTPKDDLPPKVTKAEERSMHLAAIDFNRIVTLCNGEYKTSIEVDRVSEPYNLSDADIRNLANNYRKMKRVRKSQEFIRGTLSQRAYDYAKLSGRFKKPKGDNYRAGRRSATLGRTGYTGFGRTATNSRNILR